MKRKYIRKKSLLVPVMVLVLACGCSNNKKEDGDNQTVSSEVVDNETTKEKAVEQEIPDEKDENQKAEEARQNVESEVEQPGVEAVYLGVHNYGAAGVNETAKDNFSYRFEIDGQERILSIQNGENYPIQNVLKEGYTYTILLEDTLVTEAIEKEAKGGEEYQPPVKGTAGKRTLKNFLATAFMPVGKTLYVYGGGWDWQDEGTSIQARSIGVSADWVKFFESQNENYTFKSSDASRSYYPYGGYNEYYYAGLDCSGYVGWAVYNEMHAENGLEGYVRASTTIAKSLAEKGWGAWTQNVYQPYNHDNSQFLPGDVFSMKGHVWICLGTCEDGSILILHSTPQYSRTGQPGGGPELSAIGGSKSCEAYRLADQYMLAYYPEWYERYSVALKNYWDYTAIEGADAGKFSWNLTGENGGISDPDGYIQMTPAEILEDLFQEAGKE